MNYLKLLKSGIKDFYCTLSLWDHIDKDKYDKNMIWVKDFDYVNYFIDCWVLDKNVSVSDYFLSKDWLSYPDLDYFLDYLYNSVNSEIKRKLSIK